MEQLLEAHSLTQVLFNLPSGDWSAGERDIACRGDRVDEFREGVIRPFEYAGALADKQMSFLAGIVPKDSKLEHFQENLAGNLAFAA